MNALIIYDDFALAVKANATLARAPCAHWEVKPWRVDVLKLPTAASAALAEAADAHLIVFAVRRPQFLPDWLVDWLEQWATRRHVQEAALGLLDGWNSDPLSATAARGLSQFAERHGLSFIVGDMGPTQDECTAPARSPRVCNAGSAAQY